MNWPYKAVNYFKAQFLFLLSGALSSWKFSKIVGLKFRPFTTDVFAQMSQSYHILLFIDRLPPGKEFIMKQPANIEKKNYGHYYILTPCWTSKPILLLVLNLVFDIGEIICDLKVVTVITDWLPNDGARTIFLKSEYISSTPSFTIRPICLSYPI